MKKRISALIAAVCILTSIVPLSTVQAKTNDSAENIKTDQSDNGIKGRRAITAEEVEKLIYAETLENNDRKDEFLDLRFPLNGDVSYIWISIGSVVDPKKTVPLYPRIWTESSYDTHVDKWLMDGSDGYYYYSILQQYKLNVVGSYVSQRWIGMDHFDDDISIVEIEDIINEDDGEKKTHFSVNSFDNKKSSDYAKYKFLFDFSQIADIINAGDTGKIKHILLMDCAVYVDSEKGEYFIFKDEIRDDGAKYLGKKVRTLPGKTLIKVNDYIKFFHKWTDNAREAHKVYLRRLYGDELEDYIIKAQEQAKEGTYEEIYIEAGGEHVRTPDTDSISEYLGKGSRFSDIQDNERLAAAAEMLSDIEVILGYGDDMYRPDNFITRSEAAVILGRFFSISEDYSVSFSDMTNEHFAAGYAGAMQKLGVIGGYEDGSFQPDKNITYEELFKMVVSMLGVFARTNIDKEEYKYPIFTNNYAMTNGLCDDLGNIITNAPVTRGSMALVLARAADMHIQTYSALSIRSGFVTETVYDETPASIKKGAALHGRLMYTTEQFNEWMDKCADEYQQKYGDINTEYTTIMNGDW